MTDALPIILALSALACAALAFFLGRHFGLTPKDALLAAGAAVVGIVAVAVGVAASKLRGTPLKDARRASRDAVKDHAERTDELADRIEARKERVSQMIEDARTDPGPPTDPPTTAEERERRRDAVRRVTDRLR